MKTMDDLRATLFGAIEDLRKGKLEVAAAKTVAELGQTIINTAKAESDYARATGQTVVSGLITATAAPAPESEPEQNGTTRTPTGVKKVEGHRTIHKLR